MSPAGPPSRRSPDCVARDHRVQGPRPRRRNKGLAALFLGVCACSQPPADDGAATKPPPPVAPEAAPAPASARAQPPEQPEALKEAQTPVAAPQTFGPAKLTLLTDEERKKLLAGDADAPIPVEISYIQSNETRHDLFFPYIENKGGVFVAVASDPGYTMMAAARSEFAFFIDIDRRVVDLHRIYERFIVKAETPEALVAMWHADNEEESKAFLSEQFEDASEKDLRKILQGYRVGRETVYRHLLRVVDRTVDGKPASWLSDPEMYAHVRAMYQTGRIRIMPGDLTGAASLTTIGAVTRELGQTVKVLYVSNAEEYFKYTPQFRANIQGFPIDEESVLLRTIYSKKWEHADLWAYQVQTLKDFQTRLSDNLNRSRRTMLRLAGNAGELDKTTGITGFSRLGMEQGAGS